MYASSTGELRYAARLEDLVFCALGLLELYRADFDPGHLLRAQALARELPARFADERGGYFVTASDAEALLFRPKETGDGAMPSGNSAAAVLFDRLFRLTAEEEWRALGDAQAAYLAAAVGETPASCCYAMCAFLLRETGGKELVAVLPDEELPETLKAVLGRWAPELSVLVKSPARAEALAQAAPFTAPMSAKDGKAVCHLCENGACGLPMEL